MFPILFATVVGIAIGWYGRRRYYKQEPQLIRVINEGGSDDEELSD